MIPILDTHNVLANFRVSKQRLREAKLQAVDYLILLLAGACLGSLSKASDDQNFGAAGYSYTIIAVCKFDKLSFLCFIVYTHKSFRILEEPCFNFAYF